MTENQRVTLSEIEAGRVAMRRQGRTFRIDGADAGVVGRCVVLGWATWPKGPLAEQTCEITAAGKNALAAAQA